MGTTDKEYSLRGSDGSTVETGTLIAAYFARPVTTDEFRPASGPSRLAVYDIIGDTLRLALGATGGARPASLSEAAVYTTR